MRPLTEHEPSIQGWEKLEVIPQFSSYAFDRIEEVRFRRQESLMDGATRELDLVLRYSHHVFGSYLVAMRFTGLVLAKLPAFSPDAHLGELGLADISMDQIEGGNYRLQDYLASEIDIISERLEIVDCIPES